MDAPPTGRPGLKRGVQDLAGMTPTKYNQWLATKTMPRSSEAHSVWASRPISLQGKEYAVGDVRPLKAMYDNVTSMLNARGVKLIEMDKHPVEKDSG